MIVADALRQCHLCRRNSPPPHLRMGLGQRLRLSSVFNLISRFNSSSVARDTQQARLATTKGWQRRRYLLCSSYDPFTKLHLPARLGERDKQNLNHPAYCDKARKPKTRQDPMSKLSRWRKLKVVGVLHTPVFPLHVVSSLMLALRRYSSRTPNSSTDSSISIIVRTDT